MREAIKDNPMHSLDEIQTHACSTTVKAVQDAIYDNRKQTVIIKGEAGTGNPSSPSMP